MKVKKFTSNKHLFEFIPLIFIVFLLPFLRGGESDIAKIVFLAFPLLYLPILLRRRRKIYFPFLLTFWAWMAFLLVAFISTVFSASLSISVSVFFELMGVFLYFLFFYLVVDRRSEDLKLLFYTILAVGLVLSLVSIYFIIFPPVGLPVMNLVYARYGHNHLADYLIFVIPVSIGLFLQQKKKLQILITALLVAFFFISFYLTFARAAFLVVSLITLFLIWFFKPSFRKAAFLLFFGLVPLFLIVSFFIISSMRVGHQLASSQQLKTRWLWRQVVKPPQHEARLEYWQQAIKGFTLRPLLGNGPGTFRLTSRRFQRKPNITSWFTHNSGLQVASELGTLGLFSFTALLLFSLTRISIPQRRSLYAVPLFLGAIGSLIQSLFDFNFDFLAIFLLFWILIAALLKLSRKTLHHASFEMLRPSLLLFSFACFLFLISSLLSNYFISLARRTQPTSDRRAFTYYKISAFLPAFNDEHFSHLLQFLQTNRDYPYNDQLINSLILWNREEPNIYLQLETLYPEKEIYETLINIDPFNSLAYFIKLSHYSLGNNDLPSALHYLENAAEVSIKYQAFNFPELIEPKSFSIKLPKENPRLAQDYDEFLKISPEDSFDQRSHVRLAKVFYGLGLIAFHNSEVDQTLSLWEIAVALHPQESDFHVELANLYLITDRKDQSQQQLEYCQGFFHPKKHCSQYYKNNFMRDTHENVGFLEESIKAL